MPCEITLKFMQRIQIIKMFWNNYQFYDDGLYKTYKKEHDKTIKIIEWKGLIIAVDSQNVKVRHLDE